MDFLALHNKVLDRLRENRIVSTDIGTNPYINSLSAHINDAKSTVEGAWEWGVLRGEETISTPSNSPICSIPSSEDVDYQIRRISSDSNGTFLKRMTSEKFEEYFVNDAVTPVATGHPREWALFSPGASTEWVRFRVYPEPAQVYTLRIYYCKRQAELTAHDDELLVPDIPVYTLATALASRERGELGGTPTSELFAIADSQLSDAIARDAQSYPNDIDWFYRGRDNETNIIRTFN